MITRTPGRAAVVTVALLGVLGATPWALAGIRGGAAGTQAVSSGTFAVTPVVAGTSLSSPPLAFTTVPVPAYVDALNTGSLALTGMTYGVSFVYAGIGIPTLTLTACPGGTWNTLTGVCSTSPVTVGSWTPGSTATVSVSSSNLPTAYPAAAGARLRLKATIGGSLTVAATATVTLTVSSGPVRQVRPAAAIES